MMNFDPENSAILDDYLTALFYKGVLLRLLKRYPNALECFEFILEQYVSNREASMVLFA